METFIQSVLVAFIVLVTIATASPARLENVRSLKLNILARQGVTEDIPTQTPYPPSGFRPAIPFNLPTDEKLVAPVNYYLPPLPAPANFNSAPAKVYGPPAKTYGPPEVSIQGDTEEVGNDQPVQSEPEDESSSSEQPTEEKPEGETEEDRQVVDESEEQQQETSPENVQSEEKEEEDAPEESKEASAHPDDSLKSVPKEDVAETEPVAVEETVLNALPERIILAKINNGNVVSAKVKSARLRSAKLQINPIAPLRRQALSVQPIYLVGGSLYSYNG